MNNIQSKPDILIIIPARKGSSFSRKNVQPCLGRPLIHYTFNASKITTPHDTIVSTNCHEVRAEAEFYYFKTHERKYEHATATATLDTVIYEIAKEYSTYNIFILLPPTSPLRTAQHAQEALDQFNRDGADSLISVTEELKSIWKETDHFARPIVERNRNRQSCEPVYIANGAIFISKRDSILNSKHKVSGRVSLYKMSMADSVDVHNKEDIQLAEYHLGKKS